MEEYFDIYTIDRKPIYKVGSRGNSLLENEYHIVVMAIIMNSKREVLITKRSENKIAAGKWECTAGSMVVGENSRDAIIREIKEEIGVVVSIDNKEPISFFILEDAIWDIWLVYTDIKIEDLILQKEEVDEARYATLSEIIEIIKNEKATNTLKELIKLHKNQKITIRQ